jgi:MFS transporter, DHA2 family, multidrug resistance protein
MKAAACNELGAPPALTHDATAPSTADVPVPLHRRPVDHGGRRCDSGPAMRRWWALGALSLVVVAVGLDATVLSVALPTLAGRLHASEADLQWFSSGYLLALAAAMLPAGLLGDRYGRKRVMLAALALFATGSAACAAAPSSGAFLAARVLLGLAGAGVIVMAVAALTVLFDPQERPKAVGVWAAANFLALPIGPIVGGWLLSHFWWGWVFLINVPVAAVGLVAGSLLVPESRAHERPPLDPIGVAALVSGLLALTYGLIDAGRRGWGDAVALAAMLGGLAVLVAFLGWERHVDRRPGGRPLIDLALLRRRSFAWSVILATVAALAMVGVIFTMPQYFQGVLGTDAMGSGVRLLPFVGGLAGGAIPAERLARAVGTRPAVALGFLVLAGGLLPGSATHVGSGEGFIAAWMALTGVGTGLTMATTSSAALAELSPEQSGVGSAVLQALTKTGSPLGTAILGSLISSAYLAQLKLTGLPIAAERTVRESIFGAVAVAHRIDSPTLLESVRAAFVHGLDDALLISAGIALTGALLAVMFLPRGTRHSAAPRPMRAIA